MPETTLAAYWPKIFRLVKFVIRKRTVAAATDLAAELASGAKTLEVEAPFDQIINGTDFLDFIHAVEHGCSGELLTDQGALVGIDSLKV